MDTELQKFRERLMVILEKYRRELLALRGDRPAAQLFEDIIVNYYDQRIPIKQLGMVSVVPPRDVTISVWDQNAVKPIAKAIEEAKIGVTPNIEGNTIRMSMPPLTDERRKELIKILNRMTEQYRIQIRTAREEINKKIDTAEEKKEITEDVKFRSRKDVQKSTDEMNAEIDRLVAQKEKDISL